MGQNFSTSSEKSIIERELGPIGVDYQYTLRDSSDRSGHYVCAKIPHSLLLDSSSGTISAPNPLLLNEGDDKLVLVRVIPKSLALYEERERQTIHNTASTSDNSGNADSNINHRIDESLHISLFYTVSQLYNIQELLIEEINRNYDAYVKQFSEQENLVLKLLNGIYMPKQANLPVLYGVYQSKRAFYLLLDYQNFTLQELLKFNKPILKQNDAKRRFLFYQIVQVIVFLSQMWLCSWKDSTI
jgi:hypothetical protein